MDIGLYAKTSGKHWILNKCLKVRHTIINIIGCLIIVKGFQL